MHYLKLGLTALALLSLAACTTLGDIVNDIGTVAKTNIVNPIDDAQVTQIGNLLGTVQGVVVGYAALPLCPPGHALTPADYCHDGGLLKAFSADMHVAVAAYRQLTTYQAAHPKGSTVVGGGFGNLLNQAKGAVNTIKALIAAYHPGGAS
jgi:hypothetical protein